MKKIYVDGKEHIVEEREYTFLDAFIDALFNFLEMII